MEIRNIGQNVSFKANVLVTAKKPIYPFQAVTAIAGKKLNKERSMFYPSKLVVNADLDADVFAEKSTQWLIVDRTTPVGNVFAHIFNFKKNNSDFVGDVKESLKGLYLEALHAIVKDSKTKKVRFKD